MSKNYLPFENIEREILVRKEIETSDKFGSDPNNLPILTLIEYGIININKPKGPTSHQVSAYVQKILKIEKSGHSGTLDPKVTGVLPVALGKATRIVGFLLPSGKEYLCLMHLHDDYEEYTIRKTMSEFVGVIDQLPPIKSSVKRQVRKRKIYYIDVHEIKGRDVLFTVGCQAGTYIRKLCLHPDTEIITDDSQTLAKDFFSKTTPINTSDNGKVKKVWPSETQQFKYKGNLIKITMASGVSFSVTPEHRMLISTNGGYVMKQAEKLKLSDYIAKSTKPNYATKNYIISDLLDDKYLVDQKDIKEKVKKAFLKKYKSIRGISKHLKIDRKTFLEKSNSAIPISHIKKSGIYDKVKEKITQFKTEKGTEIKLSAINTDLMYLIGLIASDGNNTKEKKTTRHTRIKFFNKEKALVDEFKRRYKKLFPDFNLTEKEMNGDLYQLDTSNSFLATICANLGVKSPYKECDVLPILYMDKKLIASFLRGYFDGDGTTYYKRKINVKGVYTKIDYFTISKVKSKRVHQMLLKLGISNKIFKSNNKYVISITDISSKKRFISKIGTCHPIKKERFKLIKQIKTNNSDFTLIGFHYKKEISKVAKKLKNSGNLSKILKTNSPISKEFYEKVRKITRLPKLDSLSIEKIKSIEKMPYEGYVYDMTVPNTHNFLIETGFVSSNCHDMGKRMGSGAHMAQLIRTKAGPFKLDESWTLQDLADAFHYHKEESNDTFLRKIILPIERAVSHIPKIWVMDTTVDPLCHGADLAVPGISKLNSGIDEGDTVAILTLKNELIGLGKAKMDSNKMMGEKGIAVKTEKIFMEPGTYPKFTKS